MAAYCLRARKWPQPLILKQYRCVIHAPVCGIPSVTAARADDRGRSLSMGWWRLAVQALKSPTWNSHPGGPGLSTLYRVPDVWGHRFYEVLILTEASGRNTNRSLSSSNCEEQQRTGEYSAQCLRNTCDQILSPCPAKFYMFCRVWSAGSGTHLLRFGRGFPISVRNPVPTVGDTDLHGAPSPCSLGVRRANCPHWRKPLELCLIESGGEKRGTVFATQP